jgi:hypothetical protein
MDRLLLRNPADYKAGFWTSFVSAGETYITSSTELSSRMVVEKTQEDEGHLEVDLSYTTDKGNAVIAFKHLLWSKNKPFLIWKFEVTNKSSMSIEDLKIYLLMDFDIGGPKSYKDDLAKYDPESRTLTVWDENDLFVALQGRPVPSAWDVSTPLKLKIMEGKRDLGMTSEIGPRDVAVGFQFDLGDLKPKESTAVDAVIAAGTSLGEMGEIMESAWSSVDKKLR